MNNLTSSEEDTPKTKNRWPQIRKRVLYTIGAFMLLYILAGHNLSDLYNGPTQQQASLPAADKNPEHSQIIGTTYKNTKYKFTITFPKGWEVSAAGDLDVSDYGTNPESPNNILQVAVGDRGAMMVGIDELPGLEAGSMKEWGPIDEGFKSGLIKGVRENYPSAVIVDSGETELGGKIAYWYKIDISEATNGETARLTQLQYQVLHNSIVYNIYANWATDDFENIEPTLMKSILSYRIEGN